MHNCHSCLTVAQMGNHGQIGPARKSAIAEQSD
jgi:hypothetical protein